MKNKPELIIFDLGRVLVDYDFSLVVKFLCKHTSAGEPEVHDYFRQTPAWDAFERGRLTPEEFFQRIQKDLKLTHLSFEAFQPVWNEIFTEKKDTLKILARLRGRYRLAMLSNVNQLHWEHIVKQHEFMGWFDHLVASYAVGYRKPEAEIYQHTLRVAGIPAEKAVFTDDIMAHITAAQQLGIRAHQFIDAATLERDLGSVVS
jgi:glucose-1-phosphatase